LRLASWGAALTHFTRASKYASALDNLITILREGVLRASSRTVKGLRPVICFFDIPIEDLRKVLTYRNHRRYEPFGIAVNKAHAFKLGARPVIYLPSQEAEKLLPRDELWRVVALDLARTPPIDWTFEREWRIASDLPLLPEQVVALVETWRDSETVYETFDGKPPCAGVIPLRDIFGWS